MRRAKNLNMRAYQLGYIVSGEEELHACGNSACFAGYVAVSPEFHACGGSACPGEGAPVWEGFSGSEAIAAWLDISSSLATAVVHGPCGDFPLMRLVWGDEPLRAWREATPQDLITILERILSGELK